MSRWLGQNISLIFLSLLLAFFFWAMATEVSDPTQEGPLNSSIPIEIEGLDETMMAYDLDATRVRVEIRAPKSVWDATLPEDLHAHIDLSEVVSGTLQVPVRVEVDQSPVQLLKVTPSEVNLRVELIAEKSLTVTVRLEGAPTFGYRTNLPEIAPRVVRVRGPESWVADVTQAQIVVSVKGQQSDVSSDYTPTLLDANDNPVSYVEAVPKTVTVNVPIEQLGYIRDLAVTVSWEGQPAPGYRVANLVVDPPVVTVSGATDVVKAAPGYLQTQPINLEAITQSLTSTVALQMPDGLSVISLPRPYVTATLTIEAIQSGLTLEVAPAVRGLSGEMTATLGVDRVALILSGPLAVMERLGRSDVQIYLDVTGLLPGDYALIPVVTVPDTVVIQSVIPEAIPVKIERYVPANFPYR